MKANKLSLFAILAVSVFAFAALQGCTGSEAPADETQVRVPGENDPKPEGETGVGGGGAPAKGSSEEVNTGP